MQTMTQNRTRPFAGAAVNGGTVAAGRSGTRIQLTLSDDFEVPSTPAPHWQVVDSTGNVYLLNRLVIEGDRYNQIITAPSYVKDVAKIQIWCAFAEVLLGEAAFEAPVS
jgi:hypothetical protein